MKRNVIQILSAVFINAFIIMLVFLFKPDSISYTTIYTILSYITLLVAFTIYVSNTVYEDKLYWIVIILFIPLVGLVIYLLFGLDYRLVRKNRGHVYKENKLLSYEQKTNFPYEFKNKFEDSLDFITLIDQLAKKPISFQNRTQLLNNGDEFFPKLFAELRKAKEFIHLEYFIIKDGVVCDELCDILIEKASEGVEVRAMFDYFGALSLKKKTINRLKKGGVKFAKFNPISKLLFLDGINYRNHRKITIIDGKCAFTGGLNIGDEYNHLDKYYGFWRDSHLYFEGDGVKSLHLVFIKDWYYATGEDLLQDKYLEVYPIASDDVCGLQIIDDGPDTKINVLKNVYFKAIMEATREIRISTPYLIPDTEILLALKVAALAGVKVKIIVPGKPDKKLVYQATMSYFAELLEAGCEIYFYGKNFMHSKIVVIDNNIASIGTTNIDFRSFHHQFENTVILYNDPTIKDIINTFDEDILVSNQIKYNEWKKRPLRKRLIEAIAKLFSPLF